MTSSLDIAGAVPEFTIADRLRKAREISGLSQAELADRLDIARRTIVNYERDLSKPKSLTVKVWAMATGVDSRWLETGNAPSPGGDGAPECAIRDSNPEPAD